MGKVLEPNIKPDGWEQGSPADLRRALYLPLEANAGTGDLEMVVRGRFLSISVAINDIMVVDSNDELGLNASEGIRVLRA